MNTALQLSTVHPIPFQKPPKFRYGTYGVSGIRCSAKIPMAPVNPDDPFMAKLAAASASSPDGLQTPPRNSDTLPFMDVFESPRAMAAPGLAERSSFNRRRSRRPPPDLPSLLLDARIIYLGMPLVPAVSELIVAQLLYLHWDNPTEPIFLYVNSTGTTRDDGEPVGLETEGFGIYDSLMHMKCEIHTLLLGCAINHSCLLVAAGTKGKRYMMPSATALLQQPRLPSFGLMPASDVFIRAKEAITNKDTLQELLAKHTGQPIETVAKVMRNPFYMDTRKAIDFGVVDKVFKYGDKIMKGEASSNGSVRKAKMGDF